MEVNNIIKQYDIDIDGLYIYLKRKYHFSIDSNLRIDYTYSFKGLGFYLNFDVNNEGDLHGIEIIGANLGLLINDIFLKEDENYLLLSLSSNEVFQVESNQDIYYERNYIEKYDSYIRNFYKKIFVSLDKNGRLCEIKILKS